LAISKTNISAVASGGLLGQNGQINIIFANFARKFRRSVVKSSGQRLEQRNDMRLLLVCCVVIIISATAAGAQSLKPGAPAPLQPGINKSTVDNFVGTQYWYFTGGPGEMRVHVKFTSMGLLGNAAKNTVTVTLYDAANTWHTPKVLTSDGKPVDYTFTGDVKKPTKILVSVAPPAGGLVRMGGDYELDASGAIAFGEQSTEDPVIRTYKQMGGYTKLLGDCKFNLDGSIVTTSGASGNWKLFDKSSQTYVVNIDGEERHSLHYMPGRGLCDGDSIVFQELR
jgi:hypothetical protein